MTVRSWFLLTLAGCPRKVPEHLQLHPETGGAAVEVTDLPSALAALVGRDPLARSPVLPDPARLDALDGGPPLAAFVRGIRSIERGEGPTERVLQQLEDEWRTTAVVALARGYRLRIAENELVGQLDSDEAQRQVVRLVTPLTGGVAEATLPRRPLEWLGEEPEPVRAYAERWVLTGWLAAPEIPLGAIAGPMAGPQYDDLRESRVGRLLVARATAAAAPPDAGMRDLDRATRLALERAAADRDGEQAAWSDLKKAAADEVGDPDPIAVLLERAAAGLTAGAGDDGSAGGALLALAALRWVDRCDRPPCAGIDRVETMQFASRWSPEVDRLAAAWRVVALKESLDTLEVGRDTAMFPAAMVDLVDALLGTGAGPLEAEILQKRSPDAQVWLSVSRAVGAEGVTDWEGARVAIGQHLEREATRASTLWTDERTKALLARVADRAVP